MRAKFPRHGVQGALRLAKPRKRARQTPIAGGAPDQRPTEGALMPRRAAPGVRVSGFGNPEYISSLRNP